jgi:hypothetical protein
MIGRTNRSGKGIWEKMQKEISHEEGKGKGGNDKKGKAIRVTGRGGPQGCETTRLPHFLYSRFTDGGKVVSLTRRPPFNPRKIPGTHFC